MAETPTTDELSRRRADLEAAEALAREQALAARAELDDVHDEFVDDFDAFWSELDRKRKRKRMRIAGKLYDLPPSLPLQFELEARRLAKSNNDNDVRKLVGILFGQGEETVAEWAEAGMDMEQFQVLLAYVPRKIMGDSVTIAEVRDEIRAALAASESEDGSEDPS